jgi:diaminopimelate epimerase
MRFHKFQALGNDFLIVHEAQLPSTANLAHFARRICDRHFGVGADGMEILLTNARPGADFEVRLFNADGSEAAISGNGTRCVAAYCYLCLSFGPPEIKVATGAGIRTVFIRDRIPDGGRFAMDMGQAVLESEKIPVHLASPLDRVIAQRLEIDGCTVEFTATSMGNPHCTIFVTDFENNDWRSLGASIERHSIFPERTNVEFVRVLSRNEIEVRFWERGVGETLASGTGSCGAAIASMLNGYTDRSVTVRTVAGSLKVDWRPDGTVLQTGEAYQVFRGEWLL